MRHHFRAGLIALMGAAATLALQGAAARAEGLGVGDPAPSIVVKQFVKGAPLTKAPAGKVSVVEFWATWCGPCRVSIPHLTEMAHKYPKVRFVGVSVFETDQAKVAPFVKSMGDKMDYAVAMDSVPAGAKGSDGVMAKSWMIAAHQNGIPTAFVVGTDGKIAWIGHPMELDAPLAKITAGQWDAATAKADFNKKQAAQAKMASLNQDLMKAVKSGDPKEVVAVMDRAIADDPSLEVQLGAAKMAYLLRTGDEDAVVRYGDHLVSETYKDNAQALNGVAWSLVDPARPKASAKLAALALRAAQQADTVANQKDAGIADTLAAAYFAGGDTPNAVKAEQRAVDLSKGMPDAEVAQMKARLGTYQKAASASTATP